MPRATLVTLAAALLFTAGAVGQHEQVLIDLPVEPQRAESSRGLYETAAANDFFTFDALYRSAPVAEYAELHSLWAWAMEDPIGAFYGTEGHARLGRLYPGFAAYIDPYRIVDSNGNVFYPTAETRRFLLGLAVLGVMARAEETPRPAVARGSGLEARGSGLGAQVSGIEGRGSGLGARGSEVAAKPAAGLALQATAEPAPVPVPVAPAPATTTVLEMPRQAAPPPPVLAESRELVRGTVRRNEAARGALSRSIFLIIAGLLGVGMLTLMLHTPREEQGARPTH
ncbi:MAG TPA: hypothetical protein VNA04_00505 [Thermoanaerobaculia bacterium]|nr:hypothetical protein [Thermoanaerobaculia bacterium]